MGEKEPVSIPQTLKLKFLQFDSFLGSWMLGHFIFSDWIIAVSFDFLVFAFGQWTGRVENIEIENKSMG